MFRKVISGCRQKISMAPVGAGGPSRSRNTPKAGALLPKPDLRLLIDIVDETRRRVALQALCHGAMTWQRLMTYAHQNVELKPIPGIEKPFVDEKLVAEVGTGEAQAAADRAEQEERPALLSNRTTRLLVDMSDAFRQAPVVRLPDRPEELEDARGCRNGGSCHDSAFLPSRCAWSADAALSP